jgi:branched-chain amino acid transport system ATP-binding protein
MSFLSLRGVSKSFGGIQALTDISFDIERGEIVGIMGANGAGKTTLFNVITGHLAASSGQILLNGAPLTGLRPDQVCRAGIGRTFQIVKPFPQLTVRENLLTAAMFGAAELRHRHEALAHCDRILDEMGMSHMARLAAQELTLSGQKRLELARAICTGSELILLDEVMAGLTPPEVKDMLTIITSLHRARGLTLLIIEHVMRALMELSSQIIVLHHGEKIASGSPLEIAENPRVHDVYFGEKK